MAFKKILKTDKAIVSTGVMVVAILVKERLILVCIALISLAIAGCSQQEPVCAAPYSVHGSTCCLDRDNNTICDKDENASLADAVLQDGILDCTLCPPTFVTQKEDVIKYKYVCINQTVVDDPAQCGKVIVSNAKEFTLETSQDATFIERFEADTACRGAYRSAELRIAFKQLPGGITLQVKDDPLGGYKDLSTIKPSNSMFYYVGFCDDCAALTDTRLDPDKVYVLRMVLQYPDRKVYSKDLLLDATPQGLFGKKSCS